MTERTEGLILRCRRFSETSLVVHWLTADLGRIATAAKGANRPKSPFRGKLDLFYLADFSFSRSRRSDLHTLREVSLRETHPAIRRDLGRLQQAAYCSKLVEQATEMETPLPTVFQLLRGLLETLGAAPAQPATVFAFELKLLGELGLTPDLSKSRLSTGVRKLAEVLCESAWGAVSNVRLSQTQTEELRRFLHGFLIFHLGRIPSGRHLALGCEPAEADATPASREAPASSPPEN